MERVKYIIHTFATYLLFTLQKHDNNGSCIFQVRTHSNFTWL
jgi:hypothetical protein